MNWTLLGPLPALPPQTLPHPIPRPHQNAKPERRMIKIKQSIAKSLKGYKTSELLQVEKERDLLKKKNKTKKNNQTYIPEMAFATLAPICVRRGPGGPWEDLGSFKSEKFIH